MTETELSQCFRELKAARDKARGDLCLARRRARDLAAMLLRAADGMTEQHATQWNSDGGTLTFSHPNDPKGSTPVPTAEELRDVLETIDACERTIAEYDEFVR